MQTQRITAELLLFNEKVVKPVHDAKIALDAILFSVDGYDDERLRAAREGLIAALDMLSTYVEQP